MQETEAAVAACVIRRRWGDLETAVSEYAAMLHIDPTRLLTAIVVRVLGRHALTLTDPTQLLAHWEYLRTAEGLAKSGVPLDDAIEMLRMSAEHHQAFDAFDGLTPTGNVH